MINKAEQQLQDKLIKTVASLEREILQLKTAQPLGADVLAVSRVPSSGVALAGPLTITAGQVGTFTATTTPTSSTLTLWNFLFTIYVDNTADGYEYPGGSLLTGGQSNLILESWIDWATSSDTTNVRKFKVRVNNFDSSSHDYYIRLRAYLPQLAGTAAG